MGRQHINASRYLNEITCEYLEIYTETYALNIKDGKGVCQASNINIVIEKNFGRKNFVSVAKENTVSTSAASIQMLGLAVQTAVETRLIHGKWRLIIPGEYTEHGDFYEHFYFFEHGNFMISIYGHIFKFIESGKLRQIKIPNLPKKTKGVPRKKEINTSLLLAYHTYNVQGR